MTEGHEAACAKDCLPDAASDSRIQSNGVGSRWPRLLVKALEQLEGT